MSRKIRLASYNIRKCVGLDRRRDPYRIAGIINQLDADIVVLQEADKRLGHRPAALPPALIDAETDHRAVPMEGHGIGWHGNAVLVRKDMTIDDVEPLELPGTEPRGAIAVTLSDDLTVVAAHLGLLRGDRRRQAASIRDTLNGKAARSVILGDLNEWSPRKGLEPLSDDFTVHAPGKTFHTARPVAALDRIATGSKIELIDAGVRETRATRLASDHLPIWGDIEISG